MEVALKIEKVNKTLGKRHILKDLSFETYEGEVFGFLGPNGAGKTTMIKMVVGMLSIDSGCIKVCDKDVEHNFEKAMCNIGAIVENPELYKFMSGYDNLKLFARMREGVTKERIDEVVELVGLSNRINEKVGKYSLGMRQRLGLAQAILHRPKVLILDEPTNGLDPAGIKNLRDILKKLAHEEKISVIVSSHLMSEMELMCDRVGIISKGELIDVKTIEELITANKTNGVKYTLRVNDSLKVKELIENNSDVENIVLDGMNVEITIVNGNCDEIISAIIEQLVNNNIKIFGVIPIETKSLEQVFIELTEDGGSQIA